MYPRMTTGVRCRQIYKSLGITRIATVTNTPGRCNSYNILKRTIAHKLRGVVASRSVCTFFSTDCRRRLTVNINATISTTDPQAAYSVRNTFRRLNGFRGTRTTLSPGKPRRYSPGERVKTCTDQSIIFARFEHTGRMYDHRVVPMYTDGTGVFDECQTNTV